jgi:hypothetical protein
MGKCRVFSCTLVKSRWGCGTDARSNGEPHPSMLYRHLLLKHTYDYLQLDKRKEIEYTPHHHLIQHLISTLSSYTPLPRPISPCPHPTNATQKPTIYIRSTSHAASGTKARSPTFHLSTCREPQDPEQGPPLTLNTSTTCTYPFGERCGVNTTQRARGQGVEADIFGTSC